MKPLFLVGYMGCGKSTLSRKIARRLGVPVADTDVLAEQQEGASVADIFIYEGEERFREVEREVLERIIDDGELVVVSTGGGLPIWRDNMERMNQVGVTVYLMRSAEQIASRMTPYGRQKRPRLRNLSDQELVPFMKGDIVVREEFYRKARLCIACDGATDEVLVERILKAIECYG